MIIIRNIIKQQFFLQNEYFLYVVSFFLNFVCIKINVRFIKDKNDCKLKFNTYIHTSS